MREWFTAAQLAGMPGLPVTTSGIVRTARLKGWQTRRRAHGKGLEYRVVAVTEETLYALLAAETGNDLIRELCRALLAGDDHA